MFRHSGFNEIGVESTHRVKVCVKPGGLLRMQVVVVHLKHSQMLLHTLLRSKTLHPSVKQK